MPTVLRIGPYRFFFYPQDVLHEPPHIHARRDRREAKFWLTPVRNAFNRGFSGKDLREIERLVEEHRAELLKAWDEFADRTQ